MANSKKPNNVRTALILFSVAFVFFIGVIIKQTLLRF
ncbi:MAG: cytochrome oxidase small assembly protein [Burkholderiaceae bacterium]|nr:cytochrome oxidase small assembly protein [Burkholderiaceae bacterium]